MAQVTDELAVSGAASLVERGSYQFWCVEVPTAEKRWYNFYKDGDRVVDRFMLDSNGEHQDKYNILYSSTETMRPSLYAQTPKVQVKTRGRDSTDPMQATIAMAIERMGQYAVEKVNFDAVIESVVMDFCLSGIGAAWVRYDPKFTKDGEDVYVADGMSVDHVHYRDFFTGFGRTWAEVPWVGRRVFFTKKAAALRFGKEKADQLKYTYNKASHAERSDEKESYKHQAIVYELWDKETGKAYWFAKDVGALLDEKIDPLKLEGFFPCPEPVRAVWSTKNFIPKSLYSQYRSQAAQMDAITNRIRMLTDALKVRGVYDGSQTQLGQLLSGSGNKMIPIENMMALIANGGMDKAIQWLPLEHIVQCLSELYKQREILKNEAYEITGFSDIVRGVSKASETLGAQQIKADWATGRLKAMQRQVQRFCRDLIRIMVEVSCEQFSLETVLEYTGVQIPQETPEERQAAIAAMQAGQQPPPSQAQIVQQQAEAVYKILQEQKLRGALLGIETDSTILPDEQKERQDRMEFLGQVGAFLQQAGPMALQFPDMRGLLGAIMMFVIRTFPASRPLEKEFEEFTKKLQQQPATSPDGEQGGGDSGEAAAKSATETAQIKAQSDAQKTAADNQMKKYEIDQKMAVEREKMQRDHEYRMAQLALEREKMGIEKVKLIDGIGAADEAREDAAIARESETAMRRDEQADKMDLEGKKLESQDKALDAKAKAKDKKA